MFDNQEIEILRELTLATGASTSALNTLISVDEDIVTAVGSASTAAQAAATAAQVAALSIANEDMDPVMFSGTLQTSSTAANQVVLTYMVPVGRMFHLHYCEIGAFFTTASASISKLGNVYFRINGTAVYNNYLLNPSNGAVDRVAMFQGAAILFAAGTVVDLVCTPATATAIAWRGNFGGHLH